MTKVSGGLKISWLLNMVFDLLEILATSDLSIKQVSKKKKYIFVYWLVNHFKL